MNKKVLKKDAEVMAEMTEIVKEKEDFIRYRE